MHQGMTPWSVSSLEAGGMLYTLGSSALLGP